MHAYVARICTSFIDVPDKIAIAIYFSGCTLRCKDCQNQDLWDKKNGTKKRLDDVLKKINEHTISEAVVFLGGEPTDQVEFLQKLCAKITKITSKQKVLYTGREFENLPKTLTDHLDMIICGPYRSDLHVGGWPASSNQRILIKKDKRWTLHTQPD
jgi:anaerobic ribonucleoside-triphosphate reductase activating protein